MGRLESSFLSTTLTLTCCTLLERCVSERSMKRPLHSYTSYKALQHLLTVPARVMETYGTTRSARRNRIYTT